MLVRVQQTQSVDERRRGRRRQGPDQLLELERALEHSRCQTVPTELGEAELRQVHGKQDEIAAVLHDLSRASRQLHCCRRPVAKERRRHSGPDDLRLEPSVGLGLDERLFEESLRSLEVVERGLSEPSQHARAFNARWQLLDERLEDRTQPLHVPARVVQVGGEQLAAKEDAVGSRGRRERERTLGKLGGRPRCATRGRDSRSSLELVGDPGRRPVRGQREVPRALFDVADELRETAVEQPPPPRLELRLDLRGQQWMAKTNALVVVQLQDPNGLRFTKAFEHRCRFGGHCLDDGDGRLAEQRDGLECLANVLRQRREPCGDKPAERRGNREVSGLLERARELERVERIPARPLVKLQERVPAKRDAEALAEQTVRRPHAQRAERQPRQTLLRKRTLEPERNRLRAVAAARDENRGRRRRKPPKRKPEHGRRRRIEPLRIIDRHEQGLASFLSEQLEHCERDRPLVRSRSLGVVQQQRCRKRPALRRRQRRQPLRQHGPQQVGKRSEREGRLGARRTARENGKTAITRLRHRGLEQRRLPDPRLAVQHERPREVAVDESRDSGELLIPTDDSRGRDGHDIVDYGTRWDSRLGAGFTRAETASGRAPAGPGR